MALARKFAIDSSGARLASVDQVESDRLTGHLGLGRITEVDSAADPNSTAVAAAASAGAGLSSTPNRSNASARLDAELLQTIQKLTNTTNPTPNIKALKCRDLIRSPAGFLAFERFLSSELSVEGLHFMRAVDRLRSSAQGELVSWRVL